MQLNLSKKLFLIIAILSCILLSALVSNQFFIEHINSDFLYDIEAAANFLQNKTISGQGFPAAPYFFPDIFLLMSINLLSSNISIIHFIYSMIFLFAYAVIVYSLFRASSLSQILSMLGVLVALITFFFIIPNGFLVLNEWPGSHLSAILFSLLFLLFYINNFKKNLTILQVIIWFALTFLIYISDNILVIQLMVPLIIIILFDLFTKKSNKKTALSILFLFVLVIAIGVKVPAFLEKYYHASFAMNVSLFRIRHIGQLGGTFKYFCYLMTVHCRYYSVFYLILLFYNLFCIMLMRRLFFVNRDIFNSIFRVISFLFLAQLCNVVLAIMAGKIADIAYFRYLDTIYIFPSIALSFVIMHMLAKNIEVKFLVILLSILFMTCLSLFMYQYAPILTRANFHSPYNNLTACIDNLHDQYHIQNGIAEYWQVRPIRMLSKYHIGMSQVDANLNFTNLVDNKMFFYANKPYQFIIVDKLPKEKIQTILGKPDHIVMCEATEVWLYTKQDKLIKLNQFFSSKLTQLK